MWSRSHCALSEIRTFLTCNAGGLPTLRATHLVAAHAVLKAIPGVQPVADAWAHTARTAAPLLGCRE